MNPFERMLRDEVYIESASGERSGPYKTAFANHQIQIFDESLDVTEGDMVVRTLPNGREEFFAVIEVEFQKKLEMIPSHYTLRLRKEGVESGGDRRRHSTTVNISNSQGIQIGDNNSQSICNSIVELVTAIDNSSATEEEKTTAKNRIRELMSNPTIAAILGGAVSAVATSLK